MTGNFRQQCESALTHPVSLVKAWLNASRLRVPLRLTAAVTLLAVQMACEPMTRHGVVRVGVTVDGAIAETVGTAGGRSLTQKSP